MSKVDFFTKTYGGVSHSLCLAYFCSKGHVVSQPLFDNARYDLVVDMDGCLKRVQCKTAKIHQNNTSKVKYARLRLSHGSQKSYDITDFDFLWVVTDDAAYLIPVDQLPNKNNEISGIVLSPTYNTFIVDLPLVDGSSSVRKVNSSKLTEPEKIRIESLFSMGETMQSIARTLGLTVHQVERHLSENKIRRNHVLTDEAKKQICDLYLSGVPLKDIETQTGFVKSSIQHIVQKAKLTNRRIAIKDEWKPEILDMYYNQNKTVDEISEHFGIKRKNTLSTFIFRSKWAKVSL